MFRLDSVTELKEEEEAEKSNFGSDRGAEYAEKLGVAAFKIPFWWRLLCSCRFWSRRTQKSTLRDTSVTNVRKLAWIASSICEWVFPPHLYVYNFNLNGNKEDSFLCFFSCFHIKNILAFYFLVIASIYNWLWCIHVFFYSLHTFIYTLNDNKIFPRKWYLLFCVKIWYLARKYRECLEQADHLFFSRRILKIN